MVANRRVAIATLKPGAIRFLVEVTAERRKGWGRGRLRRVVYGG